MEVKLIDKQESGEKISLGCFWVFVRYQWFCAWPEDGEANTVFRIGTFDRFALAPDQTEAYLSSECWNFMPTIGTQ